MNERRRILLDKLREAPPEAAGDALLAAELAREAEINAALGSLHISAGPEPQRERMLAGAREDAYLIRENNMNPIIRLLSGRSWPARLAIVATGLLAITLLAQFPLRSSYANTTGQALVFDLGVAANADDESRLRAQWEQQSRRILDCFREINRSAHRVSVIASPLADNLMSLSGVIYVMSEEDNTAEAGAELELVPVLEPADGSEELKRRVSELQQELELLAGGVDEHSRKKMQQARAELEKAQASLVELMANRQSKPDEAGKLIELRLQKLNSGESGSAEALRDLQDKLRALELQSASGKEEESARLRAELLRLVEQTKNIAVDGVREQLGSQLEQLSELDQLDLGTLLEQSIQLQLSDEELAQLSDELASDGCYGLQLELSDALQGLDSLDELRTLSLGELHNEGDRLDLLERELELQQLPEVDVAELELELKELGTEGGELQLELQKLRQELELEQQSLESLNLDELRLELRKLDQLNDVMVELQLPDAELLKATMLEQERQAAGADGTGMLSLRFQDHLFSFTKDSSPATMAKLVNSWLKQNGYDCRVDVELCLDEDGAVCGARAVVRE